MNLGELMDSWLKPVNWTSWVAALAGLVGTWTQEQAASTGLAIAGFLGVIATAGVKGAELWSNSRRKQRELDLEQALAYDRRAREAGTTLDRLEGHVEQAGVERAELASQLKALRDTVQKLVDSCGQERCRTVVECLAPTPDGQPGCHGLGPEHSPLRPSNPTNNTPATGGS